MFRKAFKQSGIIWYYTFYGKNALAFIDFGSCIHHQAIVLR
jgi:hypothetical protein